MKEEIRIGDWVEVEKIYVRERDKDKRFWVEKPVGEPVPSVVVGRRLLFNGYTIYENNPLLGGKVFAGFVAKERVQALLVRTGLYNNEVLVPISGVSMTASRELPHFGPNLARLAWEYELKTGEKMA